MSAVAPNDCFRGAKERGTMGQERTLTHLWSIVTLSAQPSFIYKSDHVSCWHKAAERRNDCRWLGLNLKRQSYS